MALSLTSDLRQWTMKVWQGQNRKARQRLLGPTHGELAQNVRFEDEVGSFSKRSDVSYYNTSSLGTGGMKSSYRYYTSGGVSKTIATWGTSVYVGTDSGGTFTAIKTGMTDSKRYSFVTYKDLLLFSNGVEDIQVYDGTSDNVCWELGSCKAKATTAAGSITRTDISYQVTLDSDAYVCGAISNTISTVTSKDIDLSNIPLGPVGTTNRKIYRKSSETGGVYRLVATIANNTATTYTDNTNDVSGAAAIPSVTDDMPKGETIKIHRERLLVTRDPNYPNRIYYSRPYLPGYIQQTTALDYLAINENDNDEIIGIPIVLGVLRCIKRNTVRNVIITSPTSGSDPDQWYADDPVSYQGAISPWAVVETPRGVVYLGWDHWYLFDGANVTPIIDTFKFEDIAPSRLAEVVGFFHKNELLAAYTDKEDGNAFNDRVLRYNFLREALSYDKLNVDSFHSRNGNDEAGDLFLTDSQNGYMYRADRALQTHTLRTKTEINQGTKTDIYVGGTEESPTISIGRTSTINALAGTINSLTGTINMPDTAGTYTGASVRLDVGAWGKLYWNESLNSGDNILFYTRTGATQAACEAASWDGPLTDPNGSTPTSSVNIWVQYKAEFTANSTAASPQLYFSNGFVVKLTYFFGGTSAESAVEMDYRSGWRDFSTDEDPTQAYADKIFKKLISEHEGTTGTVTIYWETEITGLSGSFTFDLAQYPKRFETFFPDNAFGRRMKFRIYKNDLNSYTQKELHGLYTPEPVLI